MKNLAICVYYPAPNTYTPGGYLLIQFVDFPTERTQEFVDKIKKIKFDSENSWFERAAADFGQVTRVTKCETGILRQLQSLNTIGDHVLMASTY